MVGRVPPSTGSDAVSSLAQTPLDASHRRILPIGTRDWFVEDAFSTPLDYAASSPRLPRTLALDFVEPWASNGFRMELGLLVTELVANAVLHGLPNIHLDVCAVGPVQVRVEVFDGSLALPEIRDPSMDSISGRGLTIIDAIAMEWGARPQPNGKVVWCELMDRGT